MFNNIMFFTIYYLLQQLNQIHNLNLISNLFLFFYFFLNDLLFALQSTSFLISSLWTFLFHYVYIDDFYFSLVKRILSSISKNPFLIFI